MTTKIEKLRYITKNRYELLSEDIRLLIEIVQELDKEIKELKLRSRGWEVAHTPEEFLDKIEEKPKKKWFK